MNPSYCSICSGYAIVDHDAYNELALSEAPKRYTVLRCTDCGLRWLTPYPCHDDYQNIYNRDYYEHEQEADSSCNDKDVPIYCHTAIAQKFRALNITDRLLDIGCGTGDFLISAKEQGVSGEGIEPSGYAAQKTAAAGFHVFHGTLSEFPLNNKTFSAAHCSHVLEHVPDANAFMKKITSILEPGAPIYIEVPIQFDGVLDAVNRLRKRRRGYSAYSIHHHYFFTPKAIRKLLEAHSFEILSLTTFLPCRRSSRKAGIRKWVLQSLLCMADRLSQRGDVISIWARRKKL